MSELVYLDSDLHLKKHGIHKLIVIGLIATTCVEATVRFAAELGYEDTVVKDVVSRETTRTAGASCAARIRLVAATPPSNDIIGFWTMLTM